MKLRNVFRANTKLLTEAVKNNDLELLEQLQGKKDRWFALYLVRFNYSNMTAPVADFFVNKMKQDDWTRWGIKQEYHDALMPYMFGQCLKAGRADLFEIFYDAVKWNDQKSDGHPIHYVLASASMEPATQARLVERLLEKGITDIDDAAKLLAEAVASRSTGAFDALAKAIPVDIHRNNEELLRLAAKAEQKEICRHLVEKHGCDIDLAISTDRTIGSEKTWHFLDALRQEIKPGDKPVPTIESLSREIDLLKETVRELTERISGIDGTAAPAKSSTPAKTNKPSGLQ